MAFSAMALVVEPILRPALAQRFWPDWLSPWAQWVNPAVNLNRRSPAWATTMGS